MSCSCRANSSSVGTAKSGVPMKIRRSGISLGRAFAGQLAELRGLGELLDDAVALELGDVIDEQHAVQMIDLMLNAGRKQAVGFDLTGLAVEIEVTDLHLRRPLDLLIIFRDRETPLLVNVLFV